MTQRFEGVIGRDWRESTPWWPPEPATAAERAQRVADRARRRRLRAARLLRLRHLDADHRPARGRGRPARQLPHDRAVLADALVPAHRAATITATAWRASPTSPSGYPGYWGMIPRENGFLPRDPAHARLRDLRRRQVAPHARRRSEHGRVARELAARPRLRPLVRLPRRRDAPVRAVALPRQPRGARARHVRRRLPPQRRPRRPRDRVPLRPARGRRRATVLLLPRDGRVSLAAPRASRMDRALPGPLRRRAGTRGGKRRSRASSRAACSPPAPSCRRGRTGCRPGTTSRPKTKRSPRGSWSASPRTCRTPTRRSAGSLDYLEEIGRPRQHADRAVLRQRRQLRRRRPRLDQRRPPLQRRGHRAARAARAHRRARRPDARTTTIRGAGRWPATRRSSGGSARCTRAASPTRASSGFPARGATRQRAAPSAISSRTRSTFSRPCSSSSAIDAPDDDRRRRAVADRRHELPVRGDRRRRARAARRRSTSRCSARGRSITTAGRR